MGEETRRELLEAAFEEAEKPAVESDKEELEAQVTTEVETKPTEEKAEVEKQDEYKVEAEAASKPPAVEKPAPSVEANKPVVAEDRPPISWKAEEKEHWAKIPPEAKAVIARRELEIQRALSSTAQTRKFAEEFARVVSPYAHLIRAQNSTPIQAVDNLMRTAAGLTVGTQQQKAAIVAEIIANYSVDVQELDNVLSSGSVNPPTAGTGAIPPQFAQMLQPVYQFMEQVNQNRAAVEQRNQAAAEAAITEVSSKPYFEELRDDMADLMELSARRGREMTLEQAYDQAQRVHPVYGKVVDHNTKANEVSQAAAILARARRAASSVKGSPGGGTLTPKTPASRREAIEQAWEERT